MQKSEMKLFLYLIQDKENANKPFREIAEETGMSLGSVQNKMAELTAQGFLVETGGKRVLRKRERLLEKWADGYAGSNKRKLLLMRFRFLSRAIRERWESIRLGDDASWGGEPAAFLADGFLQPENWDIYVRENANSLIATGRMIPDPEGEIFVYKQFWKGSGVPLAVVYADLLSTDDDRCKEAAERIKGKI